MIDLLSISVLTNAVSTLIILFLFLYLYNEERHEHFLIWTIAWAVYFVFNLSTFAEVVMRSVSSQYPLRLFWRWMTYSTAGISTVLMFWAGRSFVQGYRFHVGYPIAALILVFWATLGVFRFQHWLLLSLPIYLFTGVVFIWTGWIFYAQQPQPRLKGTGVLTGTFILWGLHKLDYPFLRPVEAFAPYGYILSTVFGQLAAVGLIVLVLEESKRDVRLASEELQRAYRDLEQTMNELQASIRELDETQEFLSSILESAQEGIISTDPEGRVTFCNEAGARLLGREVTQMLGHPLTLRVHILGETEDLMPRLMACVPREERYEATVELLREDAPSVSALLTATAVYNMERQYIGMLVLIHDTTQQKRLEERVIASEKLATIGRMASYIAHEIKNPLSSVNLNLELLADEIASYAVPSTEEAMELLNSIQEEIDRLTHNIDEYLRFARLPKLRLHLGDINILLESLLQLIEPELAQHQIRVIHEWDYDVPPVRIDGENLRSVFLNLIRNAREAMPEGGELRLSTQAVDKHVLIRIEDTGHGIREEDMPFIFEPFFTTKASGTGLGLPYVQQIIHQHGGTIECHSRVGKGTQFVISLPAAELSVEDPSEHS